MVRLKNFCLRSPVEERELEKFRSIRILLIYTRQGNRLKKKIIKIQTLQVIFPKIGFNVLYKKIRIPTHGTTTRPAAAAECRKRRQLSGASRLWGVKEKYVHVTTVAAAAW